MCNHLAKRFEFMHVNSVNYMKTIKKKKLSVGERLPTEPQRPGQMPDKFNEIAEFGIGMDVHKHIIAVCVSGRIPSGQTVDLKEHGFRNDFSGLGELCTFLSKYMPKATVLMECTGVYHVSLYQTLIQEYPDYRDRIIAMNPLLVHNRIADLGTKTDRADARTLASLAFYKGILRPSYVGTREFFAVRDFMRSYRTTVTRMTQAKNRIHRHLDLVNQKFPFDLGTEWGLALLDRYISDSWGLGAAYESLLADLHREKKGKVLERQREAIMPHAEVTLSQEQRKLLEIELINLIQAQEAAALFILQAERYIIAHKGLRMHYEHLHILPGFSSVVVLTVLTEIGDYSRFRTANAFSKFCGVVPTVEQSGTMRSKGHINRFTNRHLRQILSQAASAVLGRPNKNTDIGAFAYRQLRHRRLPYKKAMLKVAFKYSRLIYGILTEIRSYEPTFEAVKRKKARIRLQILNEGTALDSHRTRAVKRDISNFFVANSELLNSQSKHHLVHGFQSLIRKAKHLDREEDPAK